MDTGPLPEFLLISSLNIEFDLLALCDCDWSPAATVGQYPWL